MIDCGTCGKEDCEPTYTECCGIWMCDSCREAHDNYYDTFWDFDNYEEGELDD